MKGSRWPTPISVQERIIILKVSYLLYVRQPFLEVY